MKIAESVTKYHPDKICDQISDAIVDACLAQDPDSRVAVECVGGHGRISLFGEVTTKAIVDYIDIACKTYYELTGKEILVNTNIVSQAPEIAHGVDTGGAGDQGIMVGYACRDNELFIPQEMYLARKLLEGFESDGKSQVVLDDDNNIKNIVLSVQNKSQQELREHIDKFMADTLPDQEMPEVFVNNTGSFETGGFDADSGCTGRKIVVDAYGPRISVGGGAFSGKDATKVDRSAAYMARWIALDILHDGSFDEVIVKIGYVIGGSEPVLLDVIVNDPVIGWGRINVSYDCSPKTIIEKFDLKKPIYKDLAANGHFGRPELPWEQHDNSN